MFDPIAKERLKGFYMGKLYPLFVCAMVLVGYLLGIEVFLLPIVVLVACLSFWVCDSIRPIFAPLCTFVYAFSNKNSLFGEVSSDYYVTGWRIVALVLLAIIVLISLIAFVTRTQIFSKMTVRKTPLLIPLLLLSAAFLLNGIGSGRWVVNNLVYASFQVIAFLLVFVLFYHGFSDEESAEELGDYFSYMTLLISLLLIAEMAALYLGDPGVIENGEIMKMKIVFGWGICNNAGTYISVLIPMNFYGATRSKHPIVYVLVATATYVAAVLTMSRNALLCSSIAFLACLIGFSLFGKRRKFFAYTCLSILLAAGVAFITYNEQILTALSSYSKQGLSDSGRFKIWQEGITRFLEAPLFGNGFRGGLETGTLTATFIPAMAHNTVVQLLTGMGIFGFASYSYYRLCTLKAFFCRPSLLKTMLGASMLVLLVGSLLDNFLFHIQPVFYYSIAMAIVYRHVDEEIPWRCLIKD